MSDFLAPFVALGEGLERAFAQAEYAEEAFCALATEHVERAKLHESFDLAELTRWVLRCRSLPPQHDVDGRFGNPPVTLWYGRRFMVTALIWRQGSTSIHQHGFSGAFQVLQGSSVHARYVFNPRRELSEDFLLGHLDCAEIEKLEVGMVRGIHAGSGGIHSLFHLNHPSVSLVVRTIHDARNPIQLNFYRPGVARWDLRRETEEICHRRFLRMMLDVDCQAAELMLADALRPLSAFHAFGLLDEVRSAGHLELGMRALSAASTGMDGEVVEAIDAALREVDRVQRILDRRHSVRDPRLRYLLAILANAPSRNLSLALAKAEFPERDAADVLIEHLCGLTNVTLSLQTRIGAWQPNVFGLPEPDEASRNALRKALSGQVVDEEEKLPFYSAIRHGSAFQCLFEE